MRVLHVTPSVSRRYGGPTEALCGYITAAQLHGVTVDVAAPTCDAADAAWLSARLPDVKFHYRPSIGSGAFVTSPQLWNWLRASVRDYDFVHVHGLLNLISSGAADMCIRQNQRFAIEPLGTLSRFTFRYRRAALKRAYFRVLDRRAVEKATVLHFTTRAERDEALWHGVDFGGRAHVIAPPYVGDLADCDSISEPQPFEVLFLGRVHPVKNIEMLFDAWRVVRHEAGGARLRIVGECEPQYKAELHGRLTQLGITDSVEFNGFVTGAAKARLLRRAQVLVLPSHHENFGMVVLEALVAGVPVVLSPKVQIAPFVREHQLGLLASTPNELAACITSVRQDPRLRARCRAHGRELVTQFFSPAAIGRQLVMMYTS